MPIEEFDSRIRAIADLIEDETPTDSMGRIMRSMRRKLNKAK